MCSSKDREEPRKAFLIAFLPQIYLLMTGILAVSLCLVELCWNECTNLLEPGAPVKTVMSFRPYGLLATLWPNEMSSTGWEILDKLPNIRRRPSVSSLAVNNIYVYSHIWSIVLVVAIENLVWWSTYHHYQILQLVLAVQSDLGTPLLSYTNATQMVVWESKGCSRKGLPDTEHDELRQPRRPDHRKLV